MENKMKKSEKIYHFIIDESTLEIKATPQIIQIYKIVLDNGELEISESNLKKLLEDCKKGGVLKTRQSSTRIFQYYKNVMISDGFLKVNKSEENSEVVQEVVNA